MEVEWTGRTQQPSMLLCLSGNGDLKPLQSVPCALMRGPVTESTLYSRKKCFCSTSSHVWRLCDPQPNTKGKGRWALGVYRVARLHCFVPCLECQAPNNHGHITMLCTCPWLWAQLQLVLPPPAGIRTESLCSSWHTGVPATTWFLPYTGRAPPWAPGCSAELEAHLSFSLFSPVLSHLSTFTYVNVWISQVYLCIEHEILC